MRWRVSAFLLVSFAAGFFSVPSSAETVTLPDPLSTNLYTTVEAWVDLETVPTLVLTEEQKTDWLNRLYNITTYTRDDAVAFYYEIYNLTQDIHDYVYNFEQNADFPADISDEFIEQWETLVDDINFRLNLYQQDAYAFITGVTNQIEVVDRIVTEIQDLPYTNVIKSVSLGQQYGYTQGGMCHCPDYTVYLQGLQSELKDYHDFMYETLHWIGDFRQGWLSKISTDYSSGSIVAETLLKLWEWPFSVSVTNMQEWIDAVNSNDVSIRVYNDEYNPLWVDFTNSLSVSLDSISGDVYFRAEVAVTNFFDMFDVLTNAYTVSNASRNEDDLSFANEQLEGLDEMEEDDLEIHEETYTTVQQLGGTIRGVYDDYASIFDSIPSEMPSDIVIHQGWTLGGITVTSLHWQPGANSGVARCLNFIRTLARSIWFFFTVVVVFHCVGIDVYVAGLLAVVVYGALFSKPEVIAKGFRFFWKIASGILGRNKE